MDDLRFDALARVFGGAASRRAALAALLGLAAGAVAGADVAEARRRRCRPACPAGQSCDRATRTCRCDDGGAVCGATCCLIGQRCDGGQCVEQPAPGSCIASGEPCKDVGLPCCENLQCGSGQGGGEIACWVRKTGRCTSTAECVYGTACVDGLCIAPVPPPPPPVTECTVCASGCPFTTIEAAIRAASSGDVITVGAGTYRPVPMVEYAYLLIERPMTLQACAATAGAVIVQCPATDDDTLGACIAPANEEGVVVMSGLTLAGPDTLQAPGPLAAVYRPESVHEVPGSLVLTDLTVYGFAVGVWFGGPEGSGLTLNRGSYSGLNFETKGIYSNQPVSCPLGAPTYSNWGEGKNCDGDWPGCGCDGGSDGEGGTGGDTGPNPPPPPL